VMKASFILVAALLGAGCASGQSSEIRGLLVQKGPAQHSVYMVLGAQGNVWELSCVDASKLPAVKALDGTEVAAWGRFSTQGAGPQLGLGVFCLERIEPVVTSK